MVSMADTNQRIETFARTMGRAIAKLAKTDLQAARRMGDLAQRVAEEIRAGRL